MFSGIHGNRNQVDASLITMREDPNIEFGRLEDLENDFGFGIDPTEEPLMDKTMQNAFQGGLFERPVSEIGN